MSGEPTRQPAAWVEDRRVRLRVDEAERGVLPARLTPREWRRMADASRAHTDECLLLAMRRGLLGP